MCFNPQVALIGRQGEGGDGGGGETALGGGGGALPEEVGH